uniref:Lipocalin n=1 Tax=Rhipicephalus appendiculatus TaxID=34631 RepID=A0A131Z836_RHIAP
MLLLILLLCCEVCHIMASCPEKEQPGRCNGDSFFPQLYCGDVFMKQEKWTCHKKNRDRCVCSPPLFRREDGQCVPQNKCEGDKKEVQKKPEQSPPTESEGSPYEIPESLKPTSKDVNTVLKFIRNKNILYLLMGMRNDMPVILKNHEVCLRSAFITNFTSGALRTLSSYKHVQLIGSHITMSSKQEIAEFLLGGVDDGQIRITVKIDGTAIATESSPVVLKESFFVLDVGDECLLLAYGPGSSSLKCLLWGSDPANIQNTKCYQSMKTSCRANMKEFMGPGGPCLSIEEPKEITSEDQEKRLENNGVIKLANGQMSTDVLKFLQNKDKIFLQMADEDDWVKSDCECVRSEFHAETLHGSQRNLECYFYTRTMSQGTTRNKVPKKRMAKLEERAEFRVVTEDGATTVIMMPILGLDPVEDQSSTLFPTCSVLEANANCLLLSYGQSKSGKQKCLLLGLSSKMVNTSTQCYEKLESLCSAETSDVTESDDPCDHYEED